MFTLQIQLKRSEQVSKVSVLTELLFSEAPIIYGADAADVGISLADSLRVFIYKSWDGLEPERWEDLIKELRKCADSIEEQLEERTGYAPIENVEADAPPIPLDGIVSVYADNDWLPDVVGMTKPGK